MDAHYQHYLLSKVGRDYCIRWYHDGCILLEAEKTKIVLRLSSLRGLCCSSFEPVHLTTAGRTTSRGMCWAVIRLSHRPETSGRVVYEEVDGLDIGWQHGRRFVLLCHIHGLQRRPYSICKAWAETPDTCAEVVKPDPGSSWEGHSGGWAPVSGIKMWRLVGLNPTPHSIGDPLSSLHVCCFQLKWWVTVRLVQMGVSIWGTVHPHSTDGRALSGADIQAPCHGVLETVGLHCNEAQQVGCLRGLEGCPLV